MCTKAGSKKESVLPEPVCAIPMTSYPPNAAGHPWL